MVFGSTKNFMLYALAQSSVQLLIDTRAVTIAVAVTAAMLVAVELFLYRKRKTVAKRRQFEEQSAFIRYFFEPYVSAYYVGLSDGSWQVYKQIDDLARNYPTFENFHSSLRKYCENQVRAEDREKLSVLFDIESLKARLKEQASFSLTFRQIAEPEDIILQCEVTRGADDDHIALGFKDVTAHVLSRRRAELNEDLAKQQRNLKAFGDMVNAALWTIQVSDDDEIIKVFWSDELRHMLGFEETEENFPNSAEFFASIIHPDDIEKNKIAFFKSIRSRDTEGLVYDEQYRLLRKDGDYRWYRVAGRIENNPDGTRNLYGIIYDITEKLMLIEQDKRLSEALEVAELESKHTDFLFQNSGASKWKYEIDPDGRIKSFDINSFATRKFLKESDSEPLEWMNLLHPDDKQRAAARFFSAIRERNENGKYDNTFRLRGMDGEYRWIRSTGKMFMHEDMSAELFGMSININDQIKEQERRDAEKDEIERLRLEETELRHAEFRASALAFLADSNGDYDSFLSFFTEKLRELIRCDQIIYRDDLGNRCISKSPELGDSFELSAAVCLHCPHSNVHNPIYAKGVAEMEDTSVGVMGVPVHESCPVKSAITRTVELDGSVTGYLAIHYILDYHKFTDYERHTLEEFSNLLSMALSRCAAVSKNAQLEHELERKRREEYENLTQNYERIFALEDSFIALYDIELDSGKYVVFNRDETYKKAVTDSVYNSGDFFRDLRPNSEAVVYEEDVEEAIGVQTREAIIRELADADRFDYLYRLKTSGRPRWIRIRIVYKDEEKKNVIIGCFDAERDVEARQISEQKTRLELQQKQLQDALTMAESANKAKTSFLFNMSHDIRTPMNAILGYTDIAMKSLDERDKLTDCLDKTRQAGSLLLSLINNVLEMSRIESGKAELNDSPTSILRSFYNVDSVMLQLAKKKNINLSFEFGDIKDDRIYCDFDKTNRVLVNIISNAVKYTGEGGFIKVRCEQLGRADPDHGLYRYTFEDNGIGMSEDFQKKLFDEFTRENTSTVSGVQGSGLGLSVTKSFVELMGGTIECKSRQGVGTTFIVTLPLRLQKMESSAEVDIVNRPAPTEEKNAADASSSFDGKRLLLVEDNEMNREIASFILEESGIVVEQAEDGTEAVRLLLDNGPDAYDAVLMDIQMPIMDGYAATREIRKMYPDAPIPIIALSANAFAEDRAKSLAAGMNAHVAKPIDAAELFGVLAELLKQRG